MHESFVTNPSIFKGPNYHNCYSQDTVPVSVAFSDHFVGRNSEGSEGETVAEQTELPVCDTVLGVQKSIRETAHLSRRS